MYININGKVRGHCMCKELPVILVNKVVDPKRIIGKKWRAKEEERHKGSLTKKNINGRSSVSSRRVLRANPALVHVHRVHTYLCSGFLENKKRQKL
jgi:hypothetical protein